MRHYPYSLRRRIRRLLFFAPAQSRGSGAPKGAPVSVSRAPFDGSAGASRRSTRLCCVPRWRETRGGLFCGLAFRLSARRPGHQAIASWDEARAGVTRLSSVPVQRAPRRPVLMPAGMIPGPPGGMAASHARGDRTIRRLRPRGATLAKGPAVRAIRLRAGSGALSAPSLARTIPLNERLMKRPRADRVIGI